MKLLSLELREEFRSLPAGFKMHFHEISDSGVENMLYFQPFCFAGLNGSGKSNVLEALAAIFHHLELCVAKFRPKSFEKHFRRNSSTPDAFEVIYLISSTGLTDLLSSTEEIKSYTNIVKISKASGKEPIMMVHPFKEPGNIRKFDLIPFEDSTGKATAKAFLPDLVVGYSSGENEILSLPFLKNRLIHFDEYKEAIDNYPFTEPETSLLYIDEQMSQAVLLACMLFEDSATTLKPLELELGIKGISSFRMNLVSQYITIPLTDDNDVIKVVPILDHLEDDINKLKLCCTSWFEQDFAIEDYGIGKPHKITYLDFFVDKNTKKAFKEHFKSSFSLFRLFQILYELNSNFIENSIKEEVYKSKGIYTDWKLPVASPERSVFYFTDFLIQKKIDGGKKLKELLLREFSDGEHQFLHTMGICLMLKDRRTLLLLDEPETHFNPSWRAKFIKVLNDSLKAGGTNNFLKDVILTSHSPFIISDCLPNNVILFERSSLGELTALKASDLGIETYGTSVNLLTNRIFKSQETIGKFVFSKLNAFRERFQSNENKEELIEEINNEFGDSIEKLLLINEFAK